MSFPFKTAHRSLFTGPLRFRMHGQGEIAEKTKSYRNDDDSADEDPLRAALIHAEQQHELELAAARQETAAQVRSALQQEVQDEISCHRQNMREAISAFEREKKEYFANAEAEVLDLALAIAKHVLYRELAVDTCSLQKVVRSALEEMHIDEKMYLSVPKADAPAWMEALQGTAIRIQEDETMSPGACEVHASCGSVDLGIESQMAEIHRSLHISFNDRSL